MRVVPMPTCSRMIAPIALAMLGLAAGSAVACAQGQASAPISSRAEQARSEHSRLHIPARDGHTTLIAHLFRPPGDKPRPAVVMLHGCSGLLAKNGHFLPIYQAWAQSLLDRNFVVLVVDSATSRGFGQTCSAGEARRTMWRDRPGDAYAALQYLQAQPFVRPDRVALVGWSQGGGVVLLSANDKSIGRPEGLSTDFAAAVAFYPGACSERFQSQPFTRVPPHGWTSRVPLLVLFGEDDTWTELKPCEAFLSDARDRGNPITLKTYAHAVHAFDAPNLPRRELPHYAAPGGRVPVIATNKDARDDAFARVLAFLAETIGR